MDDPFAFTVDALAVFRAARLVTKDDLTAGLRDAIVRGAYARVGREGEAKASMREQGMDPTIPGEWGRYAAHVDPNPPKLAILVTCMWCTSVYCAAGALLLAWRTPRLWRVLRRLGALSAAAALIAGLDRP